MARKRTSMVRYTRRRSAPVRYRTRNVKVRSRRRSGSRSTPGGKLDLGTLGAAAVVGYLQENTTTFSQLPDALQPTGSKGMLTLGAVAYFANKKFVRNKYVGDAAKALLIVGAYKLGQSNFSMQGADEWEGDA